MKKILTLVLVLLLLVGCSSPKSDMDKEMEENKKMAEDEMAKRVEAIDNIDDSKNSDVSADQKLVNFKCSMGGVQDYYFFEDKIKIESTGSEGWIIDNIHYIKMDVNGKDYLITGMNQDAKITNAEMIEMYKTSKATPNFDCTLGAASEIIVTLPDLEIITMEEMSTKMMEGMMG